MRQPDPQRLYFLLFSISLFLICGLILLQMSRNGLFDQNHPQITDDRDLIRPVPPQSQSAPNLIPANHTDPQPPLANINLVEPQPPTSPKPQQSSRIELTEAAPIDESDCRNLIEDNTSNREFEVVILNQLSDDEKAARNQPKDGIEAWIHNAHELELEIFEATSRSKRNRLINEFIQLRKKIERAQEAVIWNQRKDEVEPWVAKVHDLEIEISEAKSRSKRRRLWNQLFQMKLKRAEEIITKYPEKIVQHRAKFVNGQKTMEELTWVEGNDELAAKCRREKIHPITLGIRPYGIGKGRDPQIVARLRTLLDQYGARVTHPMLVRAMRYEEYTDLTPRD